MSTATWAALSSMTWQQVADKTWGELARDSGRTNRNNTIRAAAFPSLPAGKTAVSWTGSITGVKIVPRWWTL